MMLRARKGLVVLGGSALLIALTTGATSNGQTGGGTHSARSQHGTASQCSKPLNQRVGGWVCPSGLSNADTASAASPHCKPHQSWCWTLEKAAGRSTWTGKFKYGLGKKNLGVATVHFLVALNGRHSLSKPVSSTSTGAVRNVILKGDRLFYDGNWPAGHPITPPVDESHLHQPLSVPARSTVEWPRGYAAFEKAPVHVGAVMHTWTWQIAGNSATWFIFAKSTRERVADGVERGDVVGGGGVEVAADAAPAGEGGEGVPVAGDGLVPLGGLGASFGDIAARSVSGRPDIR